MNSQEFFGEGTLQNLREVLLAEQPARVLLVSGKRSFESSGSAREMLPILSGINLQRFCEFSQNPKIEDIRRGVELVKQFSPDLVVAVGGGSVIDMAKLINGIAAQSVDCEAVVKGTELIREPGRPLVAIPTTAGTGSEVTHFAVAYIGHSKYSVAHPNLLPTYSIVDPRLSYDMSPGLTGTTGLDALCQATESFWAVQATDVSREYAAQAIETLLASLEQAVINPSPRVRRDMAWGALLAGKAINLSKTTAPHAISYILTSMFGIPHGHAVALSLGKCFLANAEAAPQQIRHPLGAGFKAEVMDRLYSLYGAKDAKGCDLRIRTLLKAIDFQSSFQEAGIQGEEALELIASNINVERLNNHPVSLTTMGLRQLLASC